MKKSFRNYAIIWAILLVAFNAAVFLIRPVIPYYEVHYDARFWVAWVCIIAAFAGNLFCAYTAFREDNLQKQFYNLPLITVSYTGLVLTLILGVGLMLIPNCPAWIAAIACIVTLALTVISIVKASWAADAVTSVDEKVKMQTTFIKTMTMEAENLMSCAKSGDTQAACKKVYEALRYSDPMSNTELSTVEARITEKMDALAIEVEKGSTAQVAITVEEIISFINIRNSKCKALK